MKKKFISMLLLSAMALSTFAGCGKSGSTTQSSDGKGSPAEITVMVWDRGDNIKSGMTVTDNNLTKYIQEKVLAAKNVKVKFVAVPRSGSDDKINAMMAGGNAPDLILSYNRDIFTNFATKGGLADLTSALSSDGQNISKYVGKETLGVGMLDNKQYAIMTRRGIQVSRHAGYIRKDWLDKLGLPVPKTNDELIKTLYAFKEKDPGKLGNKNVPWAMGGTTDSEKFYQTFVNQYITKPYEGENLWVYQEGNSVMNPQAKAGFAAMNKLYNDGIISKDFAVDTKNDKYKSDITNGYAGFMVEDVGRPYDEGWIKAAKEKNKDLQYVIVNAFTGVNNEYKNPAEPTFGTYIMVPKKSEAKASAVVKYLDWMADPENAATVAYSPEYKKDANGIPVPPSDADKLQKGYPKTLDDFNILNKHLAFMDDDSKVAAYYASIFEGTNINEMTDYSKAVRNGMVVYPTQQAVLPDSSKYGKPVHDQAIQMAYKSISVPANQFEAVYDSEYKKVVQAGFDKILAEKKNYFSTKVNK